MRLFQNDEFNIKIFSQVKRLVKEENLQVKIECMKILAKVIKFSGKIIKEEVLKYIESEIINSKSFYTRKLFFYFFEDCLEILSLNFIKEKNLIDNLFKLFSENNIYFIIKVLSFIPSIYHSLYEDSKLKNVISSRIEYSKNNYSKDLIMCQSIKNTEYFISKFSREFNYEENQKILANDKIKFNQEINLLIKEIVDINTPNNVEKKKNPQNDIEEFMKKRGINLKIMKVKYY